MTKPGPGKFQANDSLEIAEALYKNAMEGVFDSFGDSSSGLGWYCLILNGDDPNPDGIEFDPAYIVEEDTSGFFTYQGFPNHELAKMRFEEIRRERDVTVDV